MEMHTIHGLLLFALAKEGVKRYLQQLLSEEIDGCTVRGPSSTVV